MFSDDVLLEDYLYLYFRTRISYIHCVSKKLCQCYFVNNSVKHWPNLILFGMQHLEQT